MPNDPMKVLQDEHEIILTAKDVIDEMDQVWMKRAGLYEEVLRGILSFFVRYSDGFHHQKEELALFPALKNNPDFYLNDLLHELEDHHQMFRDHITEIQMAVSEKKYEVAQSRLKLYFNELLDHIAVENDELFVIAGSLFNDADLERMYFRFKDIDRELGDDLKKELEASLAKLQAML